MVTSCAAFNCTNNIKKCKDLSFHRFPLKDKKRLQEWLVKIRREGFLPTVHSVICSQHFELSCFWQNAKLKLLKPSAVPTIFNFPKSIKKKDHIRPPPQKRAVTSDTVSAPYLCEEVQGEGSRDANAHAPINSLLHDHCYDIDSEHKLSKCEYIIKRKVKSVEKYKARLQNKTVKINIRDKKILSMTHMIEELKEKVHITKGLESVLENSFSGIFCELAALAKGGRNAGYSSNVKRFALTLYFYSPASYKFVRDSFDDCLPHSATLRRWYNVVNGNPGFTAESFALINRITADKDYQIHACLMLDESIRREVIWDGEETLGYVDMGHIYCEGREKGLEAREALVVMVVALNASWKIQIGYFLVNGISSKDKCTIILQSLSLLHDVNVNIVSVTFDGLSSNLNMAKELGCSFDVNSFCTYFKHPHSDNNIYVLLDVCHMLKLARNALGDMNVLLDKDGNEIRWCFFSQLLSLQEIEGLTLANKLRKKHILYYPQKMKVKLAVQVLSASVAKALEVLENDLKHPQFAGCMATSKFCSIFNRLFDIGNSMHPIARSYKSAINENNFAEISKFLSEAESYILGLRRQDGKLLINCPRKTVIVGFLCLIHSIRGLFKDLISSEKLKYIPMYKMSQDHLEMYFACIRGRLGWNNNPNVVQFKAAYKQLLVKNGIKVSSNGNCLPRDPTELLQIDATLQLDPILFSTNKLIGKEPVEDQITDEELFSDCDVNMHLSEYVENIIVYIAGYVAGKVAQTFNCNICMGALFSGYSSSNHHLFLNRKDNGGLTYPSPDVICICRVAEKNLRSLRYQNMKRDAMLVHIIKKCNFHTLFESLNEHIFENEYPNNHVFLLTKKIIAIYIRLRMFHLSKLENDKRGVSIRNKLNKCILFRNE